MNICVSFEYEKIYLKNKINQKAQGSKGKFASCHERRLIQVIYLALTLHLTLMENIKKNCRKIVLETSVGSDILAECNVLFYLQTNAPCRPQYQCYAHQKSVLPTCIFNFVATNLEKLICRSVFCYSKLPHAYSAIIMVLTSHNNYIVLFRRSVVTANAHFSRVAIGISNFHEQRLQK